LILHAISQNSATDEGFLIHGSLLSVMRDGGSFGLRFRIMFLAMRADHSSLSRSMGILYWGNATKGT
jgi:hypothetical protein